MDTLGVLTVGEKQLMFRSLKRAGVCGLFAAIYSTCMPLEILEVHFDQRLRSRCGAARFRTWWSLFVAGELENLVLWCSKVEFS